MCRDYIACGGTVGIVKMLVSRARIIGWIALGIVLVVLWPAAAVVAVPAKTRVEGQSAGG
jgi:hypothetical protein